MAHVQTRGTTGSGTSLALAYLSDNVEGNLLVAAPGNGDGGDDLTTVSDNSGNAWNESVSQVNTNDGLLHVAIWRSPNAAVGANTVTANYSVSQFHIAMCIGEYDLAATSAPDGASDGNMGFGTSMSTQSVTTTQNQELMVSAVIFSNNASNAFTPDASYTERYDSGGAKPYQYQDRYAATPLTDNATATNSGTSGNWAMVLATFLPGVAGGHPIARRRGGIPGQRRGGVSFGGSW